jgi:hypothetical protein
MNRDAKALSLVCVWFIGLAVVGLFNFDTQKASAQGDHFSLDCGRIRASAMLGVFAQNVDLRVARIPRVLAGYENEELNLALIAEVLSGRITTDELEGSVLAGLDAVDNSPACDGHDRERSRVARSVLPSILSDIRTTIRRMGGQ